MKRYTVGLLVILILLTGCEGNSIVEKKDVINDKGIEVQDEVKEEVVEVEDGEDEVDNSTSIINEIVANAENTIPFNNKDEDKKSNMNSTVTNSVILE